MKPLDVDLVRELADEHSVLITIEEGSIGVFGDHVLHFLSLDGLLDDGQLKFRPMVIPVADDLPIPPPEKLRIERKGGAAV